MSTMTTEKPARTMCDFKVLKAAIQKQFDKLQEYPMVRMEVSKDDMWDEYMHSFPPGTNEMFRERREHDCVCCKQFIRAVGNVAALTDDGIVSLWDVDVPYPYNTVTKHMSTFMHNSPVQNIFSHDEKSAGTDKSLVELDGEICTFNHFHVKIPKKYKLSGKNLSDARSTFDVFSRGLKEITVDALETVIELVEQGSLYRGEEHVPAVKAFLTCKQHFVALGPNETDMWRMSMTISPGVARIRNTAIGTLLQDLSTDMALDDAVKRYEKVVAPTNYKRPTTLVTKGMIKKAETAVDDLGYMNSLARRYAVTEDVTINNVIFADRSTKPLMKNAFEELAAAVPEKVQKLDKVEEVPLEKFLADILPNALSIDLLLENKHESNMFTLLSPVNVDAKGMLKWDNNFSWSYNGEVADSMREQVRKAGGRVDGAFRFTHSWNHGGQNQSLMDLHVFMPGNTHSSNKIHNTYGVGQRVGWNLRNDHQSGGVQDVDHVEAPGQKVPLENISFPKLDRMPEGKYIVKIHNWSLRRPNTTGFKAEIEFGDELYQYDYPKAMQNHEWVTVAELTLKKGVFTIEHKLPESNATKEIWGLHTQNYHKVRMVMNSPNHWNGNQTGNKHLFFVLENCRKEGTARGFYNEFLTDDLRDHRKVFEVLGSKMRAAESTEQLSGVGFSSTVRNSFLCRVQGSFNRTIKVMV